MFEFMRRKMPDDLLAYDWETIMGLLKSFDPKDGNSYIITLNKGQKNEYRTAFMSYHETMDLIGLALEKKRLRIPPAT